MYDYSCLGPIIVRYLIRGTFKHDFGLNKIRYSLEYEWMVISAVAEAVLEYGILFE